MHFKWEVGLQCNIKYSEEKKYYWNFPFTVKKTLQYQVSKFFFNLTDPLMKTHRSQFQDVLKSQTS